MKHPIALAAKAAYVELTTVEAKSFFKSTAVEHSLLTMFYFLEAVYWTVEAGRITRSFVDSFSTPKSSQETIAGLLCPAKEEPPITTEAVVSNQQKLEQQILTNIKGIYDNVQKISEVSMEESQISGEESLEPISELIPSEADDHQKTEKAVPTRNPKPRASSGDRVQAKAKTTSSRVPRKSGAIPQE
jgi:hypothetical protein